MIRPALRLPETVALVVVNVSETVALPVIYTLPAVIDTFSVVPA